MKSWRTTLAGALLIIGAVTMQLYYLLDGNPDTTFSIEAVMAAVTGSGLLMARDNSVTSEEAMPRLVVKAGKAKKG